MSDTTTPAELQVPDEAIARLHVCDADAHLHDRAVTCVQAISAPVVAAELRRQADLLAARAHGHLTRDARLADVALLRARADELDPQP